MQHSTFYVTKKNLINAHIIDTIQKQERLTRTSPTTYLTSWIILTLDNSFLLPYLTNWLYSPLWPLASCTNSLQVTKLVQASHMNVISQFIISNDLGSDWFSLSEAAL
jgi:hypothetical protein